MCRRRAAVKRRVSLALNPPYDSEVGAWVLAGEAATMSSPESLETTIVRFLRAVDDQDWGAVEAMLHPDAEFEMPALPPFRGRDRVMSYYRGARPVVSSEHVLESIVVDGERAACWGRVTGRRKDGSELSILFAEVMQFEDGRIRRLRAYICESPAAGAA
jgi:ketosteroid isomerase-like protein